MLIVSSKARTKVMDMLADRPELFLRIHVNSNEPQREDFNIKLDRRDHDSDIYMQIDGIEIVADSSNLDILTGLMLDYSEGTDSFFIIKNEKGGPRAIPCGLTE